MVKFADNSARKDLKDEELKQFYVSAGIVINEFCKHIHNFSLTSNYTNLINFTNAHNGKMLRDNLRKYFKIYSSKLRQDNELLNSNLAYVLGNGDFNIDVASFRNNFEMDFILSCRGINIIK